MKVIVDSTAVRDKQTQGVWTEFGGSKFLIAHMGNLRFQRSLTRLQAPHRAKVQKGTLDPLEARKMMCKAMSMGLVLDWAEVENSAGAEVQFSPEACEQMLSNNDDVREYIMEFAQDLANYKEEQTQEEGKS
jgi:hypothetical protein